jgi:MYXO-CTERM domain-containing protein
VRPPHAPMVVALALVSLPAEAQFCPSYTLSSASNSADCGIESAPGDNPSTEEWQAIFDLVSQGPAVWGNAGPSVNDIGQGCGLPEPLHPVAARFPCELLKAITRVESGWRQFCVPTEPSDQVGGPSRTIISFDCGYGIAQVTSGMHIGETPDFDRDRVASDPVYNLATGTRILAEKWSYTQCVGDNQPSVVEHWYSATWAYNGLAYVNNPNNPNYDPNRGVYDPAIGGSAPYQEKVFGRIEHTQDLWEPTALAYPNPGDIGGSSSPPALPEPDCASPTDCSTPRPTHVTSCHDDGEGGSAPSTGGSGGTSSTAGVGGGLPAEGDSLLGIPGDNAGCACHAAPAPSQSWLALLFPFAVLARRRRRDHRATDPRANPAPRAPAAACGGPPQSAQIAVSTQADGSQGTIEIP